MINTKTKKRFLIGIFFLLFFSPETYASIDTIEVRILPESIAYGEYYFLGDIAELDGFDVEAIQKLAKVKMGKSPLAGHSHIISRNQVQNRLKRKYSKIKLKLIIPKRPMISRASLKIGKNQLENIIFSEIQSQFKEFQDIKISVRTRLKDVYIPKGEASYKIKRLGENVKMGGYSSWMLSLLLDKKEVKKLLIRVKVSIFDEVLVAKGKITKGKQIQEEDVVKIKKDISKERKGFKSGQKLIIGKYARRDIYKNESLKKNLVEKPLLIRKGSHIKIIYQTPGIYLTNVAIAMKSGKKGEIIPCRTLKSKKTVYAIVTDAKNVMILL